MTAFAELPTVYILGMTLTGLGVARSLRSAGVPCRGIALGGDEPGARTGVCPVWRAPSGLADEAFWNWLRTRAEHEDRPPVLFPTSDHGALGITANAELLAEHCRFWNNSYSDLRGVIDKARLYATARTEGVPVVPSVTSDSGDDILAWAADQRPPYLIKPLFQGEGSLEFKTRVVTDRQALADFLKEHAGGSGHTGEMVVMRLIVGGDGEVYDCYGVSDTRARVMRMDSHRRVRQFRPDFGITSYGEIPAPGLAAWPAIRDHTARLVTATRYHGVFGVEWIRDQESGEVFVIDFNARAFSSIGHLTSCGVNLPLLAVLELLEREIPSELSDATVDHQTWADLAMDAGSVYRTHGALAPVVWSRWLVQMARCRSYALWSPRDPGPFAAKVGALLKEKMPWTSS